MSDLAVFGGEPAFAEKLHVGRPNIGDRPRFHERVDDILDRRWLTNNGPFVQELEAKIAALVGARHCIAVCNATVGLELAIRALDLAGEVIVPAMTFVATAHALQWQQITPVFCDVDPATHNLDPARVEEAISPRTTGIIGVHLWGRACPTDALQQIAERHGLRLLFDAAHAFGCSHGGRMIGTFGDVEVFSFHATKFFNTFEGGAVLTDSDEFADKIRLMTNFGFAGFDTVVYVGTNGKMSEVAAAMGLTSLESLDDFIAVNRDNYRNYSEALGDVPGIRMVRYDERDRCNYQYIVFEMDAAQTGLSRDQLVQILWAENVIARRYFYPGVHRMEPYNTLFPGAGLRLPVTERLVERVLSLPTGTAVGAQEIATISSVMRTAIENADEVQRRLVPNPGSGRASGSFFLVPETR